MKSISLLFVALLTLSGCAQRQYVPTQAQNQANFLNSKGTEMKQRVDECTSQVHTTPAAKIIDDQVIFWKPESANKVTLMASTAKITEAQKKALLEFLQASQKCREIANECKR